MMKMVPNVPHIHGHFTALKTILLAIYPLRTLKQPLQCCCYRTPVYAPVTGAYTFLAILNSTVCVPRIRYSSWQL